MKSLTLYLEASNFRIVAFYPYTSGTSFRIAEQDSDKTWDIGCEKFVQDIKQRVITELGIVWDNKVVIELQYVPIDLRKDITFKASNLFIGWYDGKWSIGLAMWQDPWLEREGFNKYL